MDGRWRDRGGAQDVDIPEIDPPDWLGWILERVKYVWPIVLAFLLARAEVRRRRRHAEERDQRSTNA